MPSATVSSAAGLLTLLQEDDLALQQYALSKLDACVQDNWFEISPSIASVEALYEDEGFKDRELAALLASKVRAVGNLCRWRRPPRLFLPRACAAWKLLLRCTTVFPAQGAMGRLGVCVRWRSASKRTPWAAPAHPR